MDFGGDSDGDVFGGGVFEQMAPIQHQANELFCFKPKLRSFNICYATEVTRFSSPKQDLVKALSSKQLPDLGRVEACELNHYALELNGDTNTRKNCHEIGAGVNYTQISIVISGQDIRI